MALTQQDKEEMYQYIVSQGQGIASLPDGDTNLSNKYLAPVIEYTSGGTAGRLVRLAVSLLEGKGATMRRNGDDVQWKLQGSADVWETLFTISSLKGDKGDNGKNPVFRKSETALEYKLEGEEDTAYKILVALSDIIGPEGDHIVLRSLNGRIEYKQSKEADTAYQELFRMEDIRGPKGEPGKDFQILGYYNTLADLRAAVSSPRAGDAYGVGTAAPYPIYIWDEVSRQWIDNGAIQGPAGLSGKSPRVNQSTGYWQEYNDDTKQWQDTTYIVQYVVATTEKDGLISKEDKAKVDKIVTTGDGTKALLDNGTYGLVSETGVYRLPEVIMSLNESSTSDEIFVAWGGSEALLDFVKNYDASKAYMVSSSTPRGGITYNAAVYTDYTDDTNYAANLLFAMGETNMTYRFTVLSGVASLIMDEINLVKKLGTDDLYLGRDTTGTWLAESEDERGKAFLAFSQGRNATIETTGDGSRFLANDGIYKAVSSGSGNIYKLDIDVSGSISGLTPAQQTAVFGKTYTAPTSENIISLLGGAEGIRQLCEKLKPVNNPVVVVPYMLYAIPGCLVSTSVGLLICDSIDTMNPLRSPENGCYINIGLTFYSYITSPLAGMLSIVISNFNTDTQEVFYNYMEDTKFVDIEDSLISASTSSALSANQGRILKQGLDKRVSSEEVTTIKKLTQAAYNALPAKDSKTLYACQQTDGTIVIR